MSFTGRLRCLLALLVAVFGVLVAVPQPASATSLVPFRAIMVETFTLAMCSPTLLCPTATGRGWATHLGKTRESATVVVDLAHPDAAGCLPETRTTILTAANGDQVMMSATGKSCDTSPTTVRAVDAYVVTGGTGRFRGASGSGINSASIDLERRTAVVTYRGTLAWPGARQ